MEKTAEWLKVLQLPVETIDIRQLAEASAILYDRPFVAEGWSNLGGFIESHPGAALLVTEKILRSGAVQNIRQPRYSRPSTKSRRLKISASAIWKCRACDADIRWHMDKRTGQKRSTNHSNLLDMCAIAVPAGEAGTYLSFGISFFAKSENEHLLFGAGNAFVAAINQTLIAVCGLHMQGSPFEKELVSMGPGL
nr:hypothetical protein [Heyndrickxia coagulans]